MGNCYPRAYNAWSRYRKDQVLYPISDQRVFFSDTEVKERKTKGGYNCLSTWTAGFKDDTEIFKGVR